MKLYIYKHCPYCTRVRTMIGLKGIECDIEYLLDDDIDTPTRMVGKKVVPILEKDSGEFLAESLDIVSYLDTLNGSPVLQESKKRQDIADLFEKYNMAIRELVYSFMIEAEFPELEKPSARAYFTNRIMTKLPYENFTQLKVVRYENYQCVEQFLSELDTLIYNNDFISKGGFGYDDIIYFSALHSLTVVPNLEWASAVDSYVATTMEKTNIEPYISS